MNLQLCKNLKEEKTLRDYLTIKVTETQLPRTYLNQTTKDKNTMLVTTIADGDGFTECIVYDITKFPVFKKGNCVIINDVIVKADGYVYDLTHKK